MKKAKAKTGCKCTQQLNEQIKSQGLELDSRMVMDFGAKVSGSIDTPIIKLVWIDTKRKKPCPPVFCSYCPFCGVKKQW